MLPRKLIHLPNKDKGFHESWTKDRDPLNIPHPFRCLLNGLPNKGKTSAIFNILARVKPEFEKVYLLHCDGKTKEYDQIDVVRLQRIPDPESKFWDPKVKTAVIIDDVNLKKLPKDEQGSLNRLLGYVSTHKNVSVFITCQNYFDLPACVMKCSNFFVLWEPNDLDSLGIIGRRVGLNKKKLNDIHDKVWETNRDKRTSLWLDKTKGTPYPMRIDGYEMI